MVSIPYGADQVAEVAPEDERVTNAPCGGLRRSSSDALETLRPAVAASTAAQGDEGAKQS